MQAGRRIGGDADLYTPDCFRPVFSDPRLGSHRSAHRGTCLDRRPCSRWALLLLLLALCVPLRRVCCQNTRIFAWGGNKYGQLGIGWDRTSAPLASSCTPTNAAPLALDAGDSVSKIVAGAWE